MESITLSYPSFGLLFCLLAGLIYAFVLYFRDKTFKEQPAWFVPLLFALRTLVVGGLCVLLLEPVLRRTQRDTKLPIVVVAQDVSGSIGEELGPEGVQSLRNNLEDIAQNSREDYDLKYFSFGSEVRTGLVDSFQDKSTDIGAPLQAIYDLYSDQNLGAVILSTDGRFNQGSNPLYQAERLGVPVFPVLLGDTIPKKDLILRRVYHNQIAYLGDRFQVQVDVGARALAGSSTLLTLSRVTPNGLRKVEERALTIDNNDFFQTLEFELEAVAAGVQQYRFSLRRLEGEVSGVNNVKDIYIDVLDARQKVLIIAQAPHPDLTALRQTLLKGKNYEVTIAYANKELPVVKEFDLLVFHGLPGRTYSNPKLFDAISKSELPRMFLLTGETNLNQLNQVQGMVRFQGDGRSKNDAQAIPASGFNLFNVSDPLRLGISAFPPLEAPFGEYQLAPFASALLYQRIGRVDTRFPLLVMGEDQGRRTGILLGEGLWRWRLFDYLQHENHELFDELVKKSLQYVGLKDDKRKFRVTLPKNLFQETEAIPFNAELYNDNYELVNAPDVLLTLFSEETGDEFNFTFDKVGKVYGLNVGRFPVGRYRYEASTRLNGVDYQASGQFSVQPIQLELYETTADFGGLRLIAERTGGVAVSSDNIQAIPEQLTQLPGMKPTVYSSVASFPLLNLKWLFFVLMGLLSLEWFLRRYFGAY